VAVSSVTPALAEETSPEVAALPAVLTAELSAAETRTLAATTSGEGVPLAAFVTTPTGPEIVSLDADSHADAAAAVALLNSQPSVEAADVSTVVRPLGATYGPQQYGNTMLRSEAARAGVDNPLSDVVVAVVDTGVYRHPELASALMPGHNFTDSPGGVSDTTDREGHGTHVAGTIAADAGSGVEGIAYGARILPVKVLGDNGSGYDSWVANGILWAADHGADVINMSLGGAGYSSIEESAVAYARSKGVTVIAAAGNDNSSATFSPAALPGVVAVSAVDQNRAKAWFSNYGSYVDVAAPGVDILSTYNDNWFVYMSGTSMASPHVAGVAALIKAAAPGLTPDQVEQVLYASVTDLGAPGRDDIFGAGLVDALGAVNAANALEPSVTALAPGAPFMETPDLGSTAVRVKWAAPTSTGSSSITRYTVRVHRGATLLSTTPAAATASSLLVTGLTNGTALTFTVTASNADGSGPAASLTATPRTVPGAPRIGTPTAGDASTVVRWSAPVSNGGASVTGYTVRAYRGTALVRAVTVPGTVTSATVTGLANGVAATFIVYATNPAGTGALSARSAAVTPRGRATAPRVYTPTPANGSASVRWLAPVSNGGYAVSSYVVRAYRGTTLVRQVTVAGTATAARVTGLANGTRYTVTVSAVNRAGWSAPSAGFAVVPRR
jgi:subtilisin family serine protease